MQFEVLKRLVKLYGLIQGYKSESFRHEILTLIIHILIFSRFSAFIIFLYKDAEKVFSLSDSANYSKAEFQECSAGLSFKIFTQ